MLLKLFTADPQGTADPGSTVKFLNRLGNWGSNAVQ